MAGEDIAQGFMENGGYPDPYLLGERAEAVYLVFTSYQASDAFADVILPSVKEESGLPAQERKVPSSFDRCFDFGWTFPTNYKGKWFQYYEPTQEELNALDIYYELEHIFSMSALYQRASEQNLADELAKLALILAPKI